MSKKSNILLKIHIVVSLILAGLVYYSNKIIHEKPVHEESIEVTTSVVMPHPPLSDKSAKREEVEEEILNESNESTESENFVEADEPNSSSIELTPNVPKAEVEVIVDDNSLDEPEVVINDETEVIDDSVVVEEPSYVEEPPLVASDEVDIIKKIPEKQIPIEQPKIDLGTRIGGDEEKKQNIDLGVQLF